MGMEWTAGNNYMLCRVDTPKCWLLCFGLQKLRAWTTKDIKLELHPKEWFSVVWIIIKQICFSSYFCYLLAVDVAPVTFPLVIPVFSPAYGSLYAQRGGPKKIISPLQWIKWNNSYEGLSNVIKYYKWKNFRRVPGILVTFYSCCIIPQYTT